MSSFFDIIGLKTYRKTLVFAVVSFLLVILIYSSVASFEAFGRMKNPAPGQACTNGGLVWNIYTHGYLYVQTCCWKNRIVDIGTTSCQSCYYAAPDYADSGLITCGDVYDLPRLAPPIGNSTSLPGHLGTVLPSSGNNTGLMTNGQTGPPNHLGTVLPSSGSNNTSTGTLPASTVTKEHNTSSPQVLSSTSGHHHHKGEQNSGTSSTGNSQSSSSNNGNTNSNPSTGGGNNGKSGNSNNNNKK